VFAGTINGEGVLTIRATKPAHDTVLAKITRMVGDAHLRRAKVEQWVTRFARIYTPIIMALALVIAVLPPVLLGGLWEVWTYNALVLLVIACPCALVISTPVSIVASLAASARNGVLIKGGAYVEVPSRVRAIALDKTGTLTEGEPEVVAVHALKGTEQEVLQKAAALEARSSHPLARAILARAEQVGPAGDVQILPGRGVTGHVNGQMVWLGSARFAAEHNADLPQEIQSQIEASGGTLVGVGIGQDVLGVIEVRDRIRSDAKDMVAALHALGVAKVVMLTGDNPQTAQAVAHAVGIDEVRAELLPHEKLEALEELTSEYDVVAMIGDGVNDAPAMARADFAIAMGAIGSDAAIETADIALMSDDISKVPWLIGHARHTMAIIRQNIGFALLTKVCFVALTALGMATMWGAILADVGVSLAVVANALRLLRA
jgi:Cd2+/Zn2+-exporting ATPase